MNPNKKEEKLLEEALKSERDLSKANRRVIEDPTKLCDLCMNKFTWTTLEGRKLCDTCYEEKYGKTKLG